MPTSCNSSVARKHSLVGHKSTQPSYAVVSEPQTQNAVGTVYTEINRWMKRLGDVAPKHFTEHILADASLAALDAVFASDIPDELREEVRKIQSRYEGQVPRLGLDDNGVLRAGVVEGDLGDDELALSLFRVANALRTLGGHTVVQHDLSIFPPYCEAYCRRSKADAPATTFAQASAAMHQTHRVTAPGSETDLDSEVEWTASAGLSAMIAKHLEADRLQGFGTDGGASQGSAPTGKEKQRQ